MSANVLSYLRSRSKLLLLTVVLAVVLMTVDLTHGASFGKALEKQPVQSGDSSVSVTGYFNARYWFRTAQTASGEIARDQDVFGDLRIDATSARTNKYEFHFMGSVRSDLDGNRDLHMNYALEDIGDTGTHSTIGYLYEAHFDINDPFARATQLRLGRQAGTRDEPVYFDGIALDLRATPYLKFTLYGGAMVNLFEIDRSEGDDALAGAGMDIAAGADTSIGLDYLHVKDKRNYLQLTDVTDDLVALKVWQRFTSSLKGTMRYRHQNGDARDLNVRVLGTFPQPGTELSANYLRQFNAQKTQSNPLSPFVDVMGPSEPFQTVEVKVRQFVGKRYAFDLAYAQRDIIKSSASTTFNRDYTRASAGFEVADLFTRNLALTLTGEQWRSDDRNDLSAGADISYAFGKKGILTKISLGTYYSLYKYDYYLQPSEKSDVRTYYITAKVPLAKQMVLSFSYEFEDALEDFQSCKAGVRYDF